MTTLTTAKWAAGLTACALALGMGGAELIVNQSHGEDDAASPAVASAADPQADGAAGKKTSDLLDEASKAWPPYSAKSFWNTPIPADPPIRADNATLVARIPAANPSAGILTSDVTQYSYPLYLVDEQTPTASVVVGNYFSYFEKYDTDPNGIRRGAGFNPTIPNVPIPQGAQPGKGSDDQVIFWNPKTRTEWAFWQFSNDKETYRATNGYVYDTRLGTGILLGSGRGAGVSKLGGLVTAHEVEIEGAVNHAVAFSYMLPSRQWVYPATSSDGDGKNGVELPEGARIQLDPKLTDTDFDALGLTPQAKIIARTLQKYGLIIIDNGGRPKMFLESNITGAWKNAAAMEYALAPLTREGRDGKGKPDWSRFRVLDWDKWTGGKLGLQGK